MKEMKTASVEKLIWVLIYGGLLAVGLGLAVQPSDGVLGLRILLAGAVAAVVGAVLILVRARMKNPGADQ
jgi:vacuolar-type H+-ATPase subunit I/STV1